MVRGALVTRQDVEDFVIDTEITEGKTLPTYMIRFTF